MAAVVSGCGRGSGRAPSVASPPLARAVEGLCTARVRAGTDVKSSRGAFYDRSHGPLHTLARDLEPVDRALAARLLEAKEAVEADLTASPPRPSLAVDLDHLLDVTRRGLARLSLDAPRCR